MGSSQDLSPSATVATPKSAACWEWTRQDGEFTALVWRHPEGGGGYILEPEAICDDDRAGVDVSIFVSEEHARLIAAAPDLLAEAREICAILDLYRADTGEEPCFDHEAIGEEVARRHASLTAAIAKATGQESSEIGDELAREGSASGMNPEKGSGQ